MTQGNQALRHDDSAVLKHMDMYQGIITRMAGNSAACKKWCIPFVTAILAYVATKPELRVAYIQVLVVAPVIIFYLLDAYYLKLENQFRNGFSHSAKLIQKDEFHKENLFAMRPMGGEIEFWIKGVTSPSTWLVYIGMLALIVLAYAIVEGWFTP